MSTWIEEFDQKTDDDYLNTVIQTSAWLDDIKHETEDGIYWDVIPGKDIPEDAILTSRISLYGGNSGISLFYLRLYETTGKEEYLDYAKKGIEYAFAHIDPNAYANTGEGTFKGIPGGLYNGPAGVGFVSFLIYEVTGDERFLDINRAVTVDLINAMKEDEAGAYWSGAYGILSDGGLVLYLIWLYEKTADKRLLDTADAAGKRIAAQAEEAEGSKGVRWFAMDSEAFGLGEKGYFPGFFYGTAGTGYILAELYKHTGDKKYLDLAKEAAAYITSVADVTKDGRAALVRYNDPYRPNLHYLGICQGPAGTSRLFFILYKLTNEKEYLEWVIRLTEGIISAGAPGIHSKGYWHTYNYCCGAAGMAEHFLGVYELTGNERYKDRARLAADTLIGDSVEDDEKRCWHSAWNRHAPDEVEAWSGLYVGSAGAASAILAYYNRTHGIVSRLGYIEDPFN